ncbi:MAG: hypothetical protein AB1457_14305 [Chloroflexota bacterium]
MNSFLFIGSLLSQQVVDLVGENYAESQGEVNDIGGVVILPLEIKPSGEKFNPAFSLFCQSDGEVVFLSV